MKKIKPEEQTQELQQAKWELLKRNPEEFDKVQESLKDKKLFYENQRQKESDNLKKYPEMKAAYQKAGHAPMPDWDTIAPKIIQRPAVSDESSHLSKAFFKGMAKLQKLFFDADEKQDLWKEQILKNASDIFSQILKAYPNPDECGLFAVDLTRSKKVIMAELSSVLNKRLDNYHKRNSTEWVQDEKDTWQPYSIDGKKRLKWLGIANEIIDVWDHYERAGKQSAVKTFAQIARKLKRPTSTVRNQWLLAYEKIMGKPYNPEGWFTGEELERKGAELCANCPNNAQCYRKGKNGSLDWYPCKDYLDIVGKAKKLKTATFHDEFFNNYEDKDDYEDIY
jgi:hypothetical protein